MTKKGMDVSYHQGTIDFKKAKKDGIDFVILREGYRKTIDKKFLEYVSGAQAAGIEIPGIYHFFYPLKESDVLLEAKSCIANVEKAGLGKDTIIFADLEYDTFTDAKEKGVTLKKSITTPWTILFCDYVESQGYKAGVYLNQDYYKNYYDMDQILAKGYVIWLADYSGDPNYPCTYQQYYNKGKVSGISGNVDMNYFFGAAKAEPVTECDASHLYTQLLENQTLLQSQDTHEDVIEKAVKWMVDTANDSAHGYDQKYRWGEKGDYDCSSAVISAWQYAGVPVKSAGATYTGNMLSAFHKCGFTDVTDYVDRQTGKGLIRGDVLLNTAHHTAMYIGDGQEVEASINEKGKVSGGQPGDQTGKEFLIRSYRNYPWTHILRFKGSSAVSGDFRTPSKTMRYTGIVETKSDPLNVRKGPGTEYGKCQTFGPLAKGTQVDVCDTVTAADGSTWLYICYRGAKYGFVSAKYIREV